MTVIHESAVTTTRDEALGVRSAIIETLTKPQATSVVANLRPDAGGVTGIVGTLDEEVTKLLYRELNSVSTWSSETWRLEADGAVTLIPSQEFESLPPAERFSYSDCLRNIPSDALAVRGLLSGLKSDAVTRAMSEAFGESVSFASADVARYRQGHYLRRHADTYEQRRFGFIFFLSHGWEPGAGGELVVEGPQGDSYVIGPVSRRIATLRIAPGYQHQVAKVRSAEWIRYSIATHFRTDDAR